MVSHSWTTDRKSSFYLSIILNLKINKLLFIPAHKYVFPSQCAPGRGRLPHSCKVWLKLKNAKMYQLGCRVSGQVNVSETLLVKTMQGHDILHRLAAQTQSECKDVIYIDDGHSQLYKYHTMEQHMYHRHRWHKYSKCFVCNAPLCKRHLKLIINENAGMNECCAEFQTLRQQMDTIEKTMTHDLVPFDLQLVAPLQSVVGV